MPFQRQQKKTPPVGIDLGTTYSCLSYLSPEGKPITLPNLEGELSTPSVVFFEGEEVIVGTEALRNSVSQPDRVVQHAKRYMGDPQKTWVFNGQVYRPQDISACILRKLLNSADEQLGTVRHAVITVPAQFSHVQRELTIQAGLQAGLERVDIINEPVATALCYVLSEGDWFAEIANEQILLVFDLGGGTFDLSLVKYNSEEVRVIASGGDLRIGGLDWNKRLEQFACEEFAKNTACSDPRFDLETMQSVAIEVEQVKRSLSVRPKASMVMQHEGRRKSFLITRELFESLTADLVKQTEDITKGMLKLHGLGWAHVDAVLVTGGASRMPMIRNMLQRISGTTLNTSLSPDQSISHGAAFYAGMLLSGQTRENVDLDKSTSARLQRMRQQSVTGRGLGILIRDPDTEERRPHYLIAPNTPLPCAYRQTFGTVTENQKRVNLHIIEGGATAGEEYVELGECLIDRLPEDLPIRSPINVTIQYNAQGTVQVFAEELTSGRQARVTITRQEDDKSTTGPDAHNAGKSTFIPANPAPPVSAESAVQRQTAKRAAATPAESHDSSLLSDTFEADLLDGAETAADQQASGRPDISRTGAAGKTNRDKARTPTPQPVPRPKQQRAPARTPVPQVQQPAPAKPPNSPPKSKKVSSAASLALEEADRPIPLCNRCGEVLQKSGACPKCSTKATGSATSTPRRSRG